MNHLNGEQFELLRQNLLDEKAALENKKAYQRESTGELSEYDNHPGDSATELYENEKDLALSEQAKRHLDDVLSALERMDNGTYGQCATCGAPIPYARLQALPTAAHCKPHSTDLEVSRRRPLEESYLLHPFGRTDLDDADQTGFDGEDSWQAVERWGTSNTPAMAEEPDVNDYNGLFIEADEPDGYVETLETFLTADIHGQPSGIVRNRQYADYMKQNEGDLSLEICGPSAVDGAEAAAWADDSVIDSYTGQPIDES